MPIYAPTSVALHSRRVSFDGYGESVFGPAFAVKVAIIKFEVTATPTPVRSEVSASHGKAEDEIATSVKIAAPASYVISTDDRVDINQMTFRVISVYPRHDLFGNPDHVEVALRSLSAEEISAGASNHIATRDSRRLDGRDTDLLDTRPGSLISNV